MRAVHALLAALLLISPSTCPAQATGTDIELTGQVLGPMPLQPGRNSRFVLTARNLGPRPVQFVLAASSRFYDAVNLNLVQQNGPTCYAYRSIDADPPLTYGLNVVINVPLAPGEFASCAFELTVQQAPPIDDTITFEAYQDGNFDPRVDPDFTNNRVTFGLGQALVTSIPATSAVAGILLALLLAHFAAARRGTGGQ